MKDDRREGKIVRRIKRVGELPLKEIFTPLSVEADPVPVNNASNPPASEAISILRFT